jgi:competence protein ComEA
MKDEELDETATAAEQDTSAENTAVRDMLREVALGAQGHAGSSQNFEAFSELDDELNTSKKIRFEIDRRSLVAGVVAFLLIAALGVYFAYNAFAASRSSGEAVPKKSASLATSTSEPAENAGSSPSPTVANPPASCPESPAVQSAIDANGVVNINLASETDLTTLSGVGPAIAKRIIEYREQNGNFRSVEEIKEVKGIGDAMYSKIKDKIRVK